jgi:uncharacterized protein YqhQ
MKKLWNNTHETADSALINIGGNANNNGVSFISDNYRVTFVMQKDESYKITSKKRISEGNLAKTIKKIPLARGLFMIFRDKIPALLISFIILTDIYRIMDYDFALSQNTSLLITILFCVLALISFSYAIKTIIINAKKTKMFHGAEHKTIYAYDAKKELTLENVKESPRDNTGCGTNMVVFLIPLFILQSIFIGAYGFAFILVFIIAYELFKLPENLPIIRNFYIIGHWLQQKLFTSEPTDNQIIASIETIKELIRLEEKTNS